MKIRSRKQPKVEVVDKSGGVVPSSPQPTWPFPTYNPQSLPLPIPVDVDLSQEEEVLKKTTESIDYHQYNDYPGFDSGFSVNVFTINSDLCVIRKNGKFWKTFQEFSDEVNA